MRGMRALRNFKPDDVMAWLIENDGIDFLTRLSTFAPDFNFPQKNN